MEILKLKFGAQVAFAIDSIQWILTVFMEEVPVGVLSMFSTWRMAFSNSLILAFQEIHWTKHTMYNLTYGGAEVWRPGVLMLKRRFQWKVDIISFAKEIVMILVLYVHRTEHSDIQANCHSFLASKFVLEIYEHFNNIWQLHEEMPISSSFRKFLRLFKYFTSLNSYTWFHNLQIQQIPCCLNGFPLK